MPKSRRLLFALGLAALAARLAYLMRRPFWFDELFTLWISRQPPRAIVQALRLDSGPPLFYLLEAPLVRLGEIVGADALARALPFLAIAALFAAQFRRESSGGPRFAVLLATSPLLFFYSAEARPYALLAALSFLLFVAAFRMRGRRASAWTAGAAAGVLPWVHYLGGLVAAGSVFLCLARRRRRIALAQIAGVLPFAFWVPVALRQPAAAIGWSGETWRSSLAGSLAVFGFWPAAPAYFSGPSPLPWLGPVLGALLVFATAWAACRDRAVSDAFSFAALPLAFAAVAGVFRPVWFAGRTEMAVLPVALWAFARAAQRSPAARLATTAAAAAGAAAITLVLLHPPAAPPYAAAAGFVSGAARRGDAAIASDADYLPLRLAADRGKLAAPLFGIPAAIESHPGWFEPGRPLEAAAEGARLDAAIASVSPGGRVFFAVPSDPAARNLVIPRLKGRPVRLARPPGSDEVLILEH